MIITAIVFLVILSVLVLIHELGHFLVAKKLNIKVEEFGFGIPPRLWGKKIGETLYSINWLPIGGFVKLYGEDEAGAGRPNLKAKSEKLKVKDEERAFFSRSVGQRALVVVAGVVMNAALAVIIFYFYLGLSGFKVQLPLISDHQFWLTNQTKSIEIVVGSVSKDSPAEKAGIKPYSKIVLINNVKVKNTDEFVAIVKQSKGKEIEISWQDIKTNKKYSAKITPRVNPPKGEGALGVSFFPVSTVTLSYDTQPQKLLSGFIHPVNLMAYNFNIMGKLIGASIKEKNIKPLGNSVSGPVGIFSLVGTIVEIPDLKEKFLQVLNLAGILSISLAFFNILPIPALDGGRLFFILIEGITGKKVNQRFETIAHSVGMVILLGLILLITFKDVSKLLSGNLPF